MPCWSGVIVMVASAICATSSRTTVDSTAFAADGPRTVIPAGITPFAGEAAVEHQGDPSEERGIQDPSGDVVQDDPPVGTQGEEQPHQCQEHTCPVPLFRPVPCFPVQFLLQDFFIDLPHSVPQLLAAETGIRELFPDLAVAFPLQLPLHHFIEHVPGDLHVAFH